VARLYFDHNVAAGIGTERTHLGHEVTSARQLGLAGATDATHLLTAAQREAVLVTNDLDFLALQAAWREWVVAWQVTPMPTHYGILLIRQGPMGGARLAARGIDAHLRTMPVLVNTLWQWHPAGPALAS
jgi:hypothetical protein